MTGTNHQPPIKFFSSNDTYFELSNYYQSPMTIDGVTYMSNEHYFQTQKFNYPGADKDTLDYYKLICQADSPQKVKNMGGQKTNFRGGKWLINKAKPELGFMNEVITKYKPLAKINPDWDYVRMNVMRKGLRAKFCENPRLKTLLLETGDRELIEDSPFDSFWGAAKGGQNNLGKLLMELRDSL